MSAGEATRVFAIRHGETDWNAAARIQGHSDIGLNARGRWQAARLADALAHESIAAVYTSDLARARDTAAALAGRVGAPLILDVELRERRFGRFEGATFDEIAQRWPEDAARWRAREADFAPGDGEALARFYERCVGVAERLSAAHTGAAIAIVSHGGVLDSLYRAAARVSLEAPRTWVVANASINRLLYSASGFALVGWNDDGHLQMAAAC